MRRQVTISASAVEAPVSPNELAAADEQEDAGLFAPTPSGSGEIGPPGSYVRGKQLQDDEEVESPLRGESSGEVEEEVDYDIVPRRRRHVYSVVQAAEDIESKKKLFLIRYLTALHGAGNFTYRTEKIIVRTAKHLGYSVACVILPNSATITFQYGKPVNPMLNESHTFPLTPGWNCLRMDMLDKLYRDLCGNSIDFDAADQCLLEVEVLLDQPYPRPMVCLAFGVASFVATTVFFGGSWADGGFGLLWGMLTWWLDRWLAKQLDGLSLIINFFASLVVAYLASLLDRYAFHGSMCLYAQFIGGIVWLLPGIPIVFALLEVYANKFLFGAAKLVMGIAAASQIGFGLGLGYKLAYWESSVPETFVNGCANSVDPGFYFLLIPMAGIAFGVLLGAGRDQMPGIILCASVAYFCVYWLNQWGASPGTAPFFGALVMTSVARLYCFLYKGTRAMVYITMGLLVLVPGGMAVKGMSNMWSADTSTGQSGMEFTFKMLLVGVCLAVGVFIAMVPTHRWFGRKDQAQPRQARTNSKVVFNPILQVAEV